MRTFRDYVSEAQKKNGLHSNNELAKMLNITSGGLSSLYRGKSLPTDETIAKLAELAGIPIEEALIDAALWRSTDPKLKSIWERLRNIVINICLFLAISCQFSDANSFQIENINSSNYTLCDNLQYNPRGFLGF